MRRFFTIAGCALLSGVLFALAIPPSNIQALGWVCFVPLLAALQGARLIYAVLAPLAALQFAAWITTTGILYNWPRLEGDDAWHYAGFMLYGPALAPAFLAVAVSHRPGWLSLAIFSALFVTCESLLLLYLPAHLALTQYRSPAMLKLASAVGIWGVSHLLWFVHLTVSFKWRQIVELAQGFARTGPRYAFLPALGIAFLWMWTYPKPGVLQSNVEDGRMRIRVAAIQTPEPSPENLASWTQSAGKVGARLVVWPELSGFGMAPGGKTDRLAQVSRDESLPAFVTTFCDEVAPRPHNAASVFFSGAESKRYFKRKPFAAEANEHTAGTEGLAVDADGLRVGLAVCFDSCYPSVVRDSALQGRVHVVALPCMGPESPYGVIQAVHGAFTSFRSAELGVPIARAESSAFAMITDSSGQIVAEAPPGYQGLLVADVEPGPKWTVVRYLGDWWLYLCWAVVVFGIIRAITVRRREGRAS